LKLCYFISEKGKFFDTSKGGKNSRYRNTAGSITREVLVFNDLNFIFLGRAVVLTLEVLDLSFCFAVGIDTGVFNILK